LTPPGNPGYGPLQAFEKDWQKFTGPPYVKSHCNGTSALTSMFLALDLAPGSDILVPSYTFFATIVPMRLFGLVPVFVDINPRTLNFVLEDAAHAHGAELQGRKMGAWGRMAIFSFQKTKPLPAIEGGMGMYSGWNTVCCWVPSGTWTTSPPPRRRSTRTARLWPRPRRSSRKVRC